MFVVCVFHMDSNDFKHKPDCRSLEHVLWDTCLTGCPVLLLLMPFYRKKCLNWKDLFAFYVKEKDKKNPCPKELPVVFPSQWIGGIKLQTFLTEVISYISDL